MSIDYSHYDDYNNVQIYINVRKEVTMTKEQRAYFKMSSNQIAYVIKCSIKGIIKSALIAFAISFVDSIFLMFDRIRGFYVNDFENVVVFMIISGIVGGLYKACEARVECLDANAKYYNIPYVDNKKIIALTITSAIIGCISFIAAIYAALHLYSVSVNHIVLYVVGGIVGILVGLSSSAGKKDCVGKIACFNLMVGILIAIITPMVLAFIAFIIIEASQGLSSVILVVLLIGAGLVVPFMNGGWFIFYTD